MLSRQQADGHHITDSFKDAIAQALGYGFRFPESQNTNQSRDEGDEAHRLSVEKTSCCMKSRDLGAIILYF